MIVVDCQPDEWFLLRRADEHFMLVFSGIGYQPISVATQLDEEQVAAIAMFGKAACQEIGNHLADMFLDAYDISDSDEAEIRAAVDEWSALNA
ncbi:MAG: hypothetical protein KA763_05235 [Xanthomonadales bacterium]|nr:hypothetical protein [Xanthomonadales bacterium]